eukprot:CAMPEP_0116150052 /NCGR_PEP_ID=MMETSP0329-20121206/19319_1 /TAXON_ID=697910 /ORGANISM="Pseudo-nitzschia arenysensis, Strain B593" /LENGTH=569 /DNA_ID=CAMNT_0003646495 /DNA_START=167 /DNA_END=1877 /DNA_ORIENTATION=+
MDAIHHFVWLFFIWLKSPVAVVSELLLPNVTRIYYNAKNSNATLMGYEVLPSFVEFLSEGEVLPGAVILPDWDNVNDYEITRAKMIAEELGFVAFAADIYGSELHDIQDFDQKVELATKYRSDHDLFNSRIQSAIDALKGSKYVDPDKIVLIGYCLGGTGVLAYSFSNTNSSTSDIVGAVSFHGGLMEFGVKDDMDMVNPVLVLSGGDDDTGTAVEELENRLNKANATWQITRYSGIEHGFTVFDSDAYNEWVDMRSWREMKLFLEECVGIWRLQGVTRPTQDEMEKMQIETISYADSSGYALEGYLAVKDTTKVQPGVLILPDWDGTSGPNGYEAQRATMFAERGYVAFVGDIYGADLSIVDNMVTRFLLLALYRSKPDLFVQRIKAGIEQLINHPAVDSSNIFIAGYCFGGTGSIDYAFSEDSLANIKAVVPIHGGLNPLQAIQTDDVKPYVLVLSGGVDDAHGDPTKLELHLDKANADWEITRYSNIYHSFTMWDAKAYDKGADTRSWWSMIDLFESMSQGIEYSNSGNSSNSNSSTDASDDEEVLEELDYGDVFVSSAHNIYFLV